ncbi:MAG: hypothetical protein ACREJ3_17785, partial [Polyangiaceae bacterium]
FQSELLRRESERIEPAPQDRRLVEGKDESIVLLECASVRRELEIVAGEIWRLLEADDTLRFDDIAILIPEGDVSVYAPQLSAVFHAAHDLPHRVLIDAAGGDASGIGEAIDLLLSLPLGRFTRQELLRLAVHPSIAASVDSANPEHWVAWCDGLGIVRGADRSDHEGTYVERDILNWDQGLRRLALGAFMEGDGDDEARPFQLSGEHYLPYEVAASDQRDAAALGVLTRSLIADARFAQGAELTMSEWADFLSALLQTYVIPSGRSDDNHLASCLRCIHGLRAFDLGDRRVRVRIALEIARPRLTAASRPAAEDGVVVSTMASLRPLPFRVVFACGMGEGHFPSPEGEDALDLRWVRRRDGDVTARERDEYEFLETILGARDTLVLSYVSRDPITGEDRAASSVVQDFLFALSYGGVSDPAVLRQRHPLHRWDPRYFPDLFGLSPEGPPLLSASLPEARAEARTLALRRSLDESDEKPSPGDVLARAADDPDWQALADHLGLAPLPVPSRTGPSTSVQAVSLTMGALARFLEFPLQAWARFRAGLDDRQDEDLIAREDESLETAARETTMLLRDVFLASVRDGTSLDRAYDRVVRDLELRGAGPSGLFSRAQRREHIATLSTWRSELEAQRVRAEDAQVLRFGHG